MFLDKLHVSLFSDSFPHYAWRVAYSAHSNFVGSRVYACLGVTCHLDFWQNDRHLLHVMRMEQTLNMSQHTKLTWEKKILQPLLLGFELVTFQSQIRRSYQQPILASHGHICSYFIVLYIHSLYFTHKE